MALFAKDPDSNIDYSIDWSAWLQEGESLVSAIWNISPSDAGAPVLSGPVNTATVSSTYVAGGSAGDRYRLSCRAISSDGRTADRSVVIQIQEQ